MSFLVRWLLNGLALVGVAYLLEGVAVQGIEAAIIAGLILGLVNALLRPVIKLLTLPINLLTLGLFGLVINAFLFWFVSELVPGFTVDGPLYALLGAVLTSLAASILATLFGLNK